MRYTKLSGGKPKFKVLQEDSFSLLTDGKNGRSDPVNSRLSYWVCIVKDRKVIF